MSEKERVVETISITFASAGVACTGTMYSAGGSAERPCVVLCAGFSGTQDTPAMIASARAFAAAGYLALTFDYRSFGRSGGEPRQLVDVRRQLADIRAAIAFARRYPGADPDRIVLWGTSLGGGHAVTIGAEDSRLAAVLAQVPFNGFPKKVEGRAPKDTRALLAAMIKDRLRGALRRRPLYIPAVGERGELAVMASREASQTIAAMQSATWQNQVAPRGLFTIMKYKPGERAHRLRMPLLVSIGEHDRETVGADTTELARRAPRGRLLTYPCAHFDIYRPDIREQVAQDQLDFLDQVFARA